MKKVARIIENNSELAVIGLDELSTLDIALHPYLNGSMEFITVTKGKNNILTVVNKDGSTYSFSWGSEGTTLISDNSEMLRCKVIKFLEDSFIFIGLKIEGLPSSAYSYMNMNLNVWQLNLEFGSDSHRQWFKTEEELDNRIKELEYIHTGTGESRTGPIKYYELNEGGN